MEVSYYTMDIYCDHPNHRIYYLNGEGYKGKKEQYTGQTRSKCIKQARSVGWIFHRNGKLTCPDCVNKK